MAEYFYNPPGGRRIQVFGHRVMGKKALFGNLSVSWRNSRLGPRSHYKQGDMVSRKSLEIGIDAKKFGFAGYDHPSLFQHFTPHRLFDRFTFFDAAAGKMPAWLVGVPNEKELPMLIDDSTLRAKRHCARHPPIALQGTNYNPIHRHVCCTPGFEIVGVAFEPRCHLALFCGFQRSKAVLGNLLRSYWRVLVVLARSRSLFTESRTRSIFFYFEHVLHAEPRTLRLNML